MGEEFELVNGSKKEYDKMWYKKNCQKVIERSKLRYKQNKEQKGEYDKQWYENNKNKVSQRSKEWYDMHKKEVTKRSKENAQKHCEENKKILTEKGMLTDCVICGYPKENFAAIDFHHIIPNTKSATIGSLITRKDNKRLLDEVEKCICLCSNCHRLYHAGNEFVVEKYNQAIRERNK